MKKVFLMALIGLFVSQTAAYAKGGKIVVNGKKVEVADGIYAKFSTSLGDILIKMDVKNAPMTSANFIALAEGTMPLVKEKYKGKPYFNGLTFHRVIPDFMIQGGDPEGNGTGSPGYQFPNEISDSLQHTKGVISMANSGPHTNGSQFFITVKETAFLNGSYSVFGKVLAGQEIADSISKVPRGKNDVPNTPVVMNTVEIVRVGKTYKNWDALAAFEKGKNDFEEKQRLAEEEAKTRAQREEAAVLAQFPNAKKSESGLLYILSDVGSGEKPANGTQVGVHYAGYLADGKPFDTSIKSLAQQYGVYVEQREPYAPMPVEYGPGARVIPGFAEGVNMLNYGGKIKVIIPPQLAYGERGAGNVIPPNAWLIFDIELVGPAQ
jgi:peptidylprolyl isomerase